MKRGKATDLSNSDGVIACSDQRCEQGRLHTINLNTVQVLQVESKRLFNLFNVNLKLCVKFIVRNNLLFLGLLRHASKF